MATTRTVAIKSPRKLIEVALPLDKINASAGREKAIRQGHPSSLHQWWSRKPLAVARAVLFAQLVNDPGYERHLNRGVNKVEATKERERLFRIIEDLVLWENTNDPIVRKTAQDEIWKSWRETCELNRNHPDSSTLFNPLKLPAFHDPFAGGGAIPLEAQRLGLESFASDLNPIAATINKLMIEIPPRFAGRSPIGPVSQGEQQELSERSWNGISGLAEDVRRYGAWMRAEAERRIGHLYPTIEITPDIVQERPDLEALLNQKLTVIAWLWARTVRSPNPAYSHVETPLVSSFIVCSKANKDVYVQPIVEKDTYRFTVEIGTPPVGAQTGTRAVGHGANFRCIFSGAPISNEYIKSEGHAGRLGTRLMAVVAEGARGRCYLAPTSIHECAAEEARPTWKPDVEFFQDALGFRVGNYGLTQWSDLFTARQLVALNTFSELAEEAMEKCKVEALAAGASSDLTSLDDGGSGALAYGQAVKVCLSFCIGKQADLGNSLVTWEPIAQCPRHLFGKQAIPMMWGFAEANPLSGSSGGWDQFVSGFCSSFEKTFSSISGQEVGFSYQADAQTQAISQNCVISTDPPYYDNIGYADLSDFFYVWMRRNLKLIFPSLYATLVAPKAEELVATPARHGSKAQAELFFIDGMSKAILQVASLAHPAFPVTIYYAFKQGETSAANGTSSAGWETFLGAVLNSGLSIAGTWPMRTENGSRMRGQGANALASSIVLVCRKRDPEAQTISRRDFLRELQSVLPDALIDMTRGGVNSPVAPVDLSQAIIGPGMGIFSKYKAVLEADGSPMTVKTALQLINRYLADDEFDPATQFCLQWLDTHGWGSGTFGSADILAQAKGAGLSQMNREGLLLSGSGQVELIRWRQLDANWKPMHGNQTPVWQALHQMIAIFQGQGEEAAGTLLALMPAVSGRVRTLAYRLYTLAERKGLAEDARPYNELISAWAAIEMAAADAGPIETQADLF
jgi:putative DNA methylase